MVFSAEASLQPREKATHEGVASHRKCLNPRLLAVTAVQCSQEYTDDVSDWQSGRVASPDLTI